MQRITGRAKDIENDPDKKGKWLADAKKLTPKLAKDVMLFASPWM